MTKAHPAVERLGATIRDTARSLGISTGSAYRAAHRGEIPVIKIGRRLLVPLPALKRLLDQPATPSAPSVSAREKEHGHDG